MNDPVETTTVYYRGLNDEPEGHTGAWEEKTNGIVLIRNSQSQVFVPWSRIDAIHQVAHEPHQMEECELVYNTYGGGLRTIVTQPENYTKLQERMK